MTEYTDEQLRWITGLPNREEAEHALLLTEVRQVPQIKQYLTESVLARLARLDEEERRRRVPRIKTHRRGRGYEAA